MSISIYPPAKLVLDEAHRMAQEILQQKQLGGLSDSDGCGYHCHHNYYGWPGYSWSPVYCFSSPTHGYSSSARSKNKDEWRWTVGLLAGAVTLGMSYFIGRDWGTRSNAVADTIRLEEQWKYVNKQQMSEGCTADAAMTWKVNDIMKKQKRIIQMIKSNADWGLILKGGLATSSLISLGAAIYNTWNLAKFGIAGAFIFGIGLLFREGMNNTSDHLKREALAIEAMITETTRFEPKKDETFVAQ